MNDPTLMLRKILEMKLLTDALRSLLFLSTHRGPLSISSMKFLWLIIEISNCKETR